MTSNSELIDALHTHDYSSGVVGVYLSLKARMRFISMLLALTEKGALRSHSNFVYTARRARTFSDHCFAADHNADRESFYSTYDRLSEIHSTLGDHLSRLDIKYTIDQLTPLLGSARADLDNYSIDMLKEMTGYTSSPVVDNIILELRAKLLKMRAAGYRSRLIHHLDLAHQKRHFVVFDTLTLRASSVDDFEANPTALRDHFRNLGRSVNSAMGRKRSASYGDVFQYFCVPEHGTKNGRLHFHCVYFMAALPQGCRDPNAGRKDPVLREISALKVWPYGWSSPVAVRYSGDPYTACGWAWPVDPVTKLPIEVKPPVAVAHYVTKYVTDNLKKGSKLCLKTRMKYRIRMTRRLGLSLPSMRSLSSSSLLQMSKLHWMSHPKATLIRLNASREMKSRLGHVSLKKYLEARTARPNLLALLRALTTGIQDPRSLNSTLSKAMTLRLADLSDEARTYIAKLEPPDGKFPVSASTFSAQYRHALPNNR